MVINGDGDFWSMGTETFDNIIYFYMKFFNRITDGILFAYINAFAHLHKICYNISDIVSTVQ